MRTDFQNSRHTKGDAIAKSTNLHPFVLVTSGITCPRGGLLASTFRFKFAGNDDSSNVSKFLLLFAAFFVFPFFFGLAKIRLSFLSMDLTLNNEGDEGYIDGWKEATKRNLPTLSDANMAIAASAMEHRNGNLTIDRIIIVENYEVDNQETLGIKGFFLTYFEIKFDQSQISVVEKV